MKIKQCRYINTHTAKHIEYEDQMDVFYIFKCEQCGESLWFPIPPVKEMGAFPEKNQLFTMFKCGKAWKDTPNKRPEENAD